MKTVTLGRTGLDVSIAGLGCGGPSRLGMRGDPSKKDHAVRLVQTAIDLGVTFIDTAESYGTEEAVGEAVRGRRDQIVISSKQGAILGGRDGTPKTPEQFMDKLDASLARLGTDYLDIYHVHGVVAEELDHTLDVIVPTMHKARDAGKIRHLALSEAFERDTDHGPLQDLLRRSDDFDVLMIGFNLLNPSARKTVLPQTMQRRVG
ncbi:MAG: aldo/keto reductase, partial [Planctomycetota bacterium]